MIKGCQFSPSRLKSPESDLLNGTFCFCSGATRLGSLLIIPWPCFTLRRPTIHSVDVLIFFFFPIYNTKHFFLVANHMTSVYSLQYSRIFFSHQPLHSSQPGTRPFSSFKRIIFYVVNHSWMVHIIFPRPRSLLPVTASSKFAYIISSRRWHLLRNRCQSWVLRGDQRHRNAGMERQTFTQRKTRNESRNEGRRGILKTCANFTASRRVKQSQSSSLSALFS